MAFKLLDGTNAAIDISLNSISYKGIFGAWVARISREMFEQTTFASGGWKVRIGGMKQVLVSASGFNSSGIAGSDPLALFALQTPYAGVFTSDTSCTLTGSFQESSDSVSEIAAGPSGRSIDAESSGAVTSAWVIA